ncbi:NADH-quinone oxidoreductase subunit NuoE [uncultured Finegoldia sp.]|uniref:NADH-quinone oxidoreductase subunit NuoE n=1 Tax=uncultured Finegoldia sp. TaxID=328009 RepID=UPI002603FBAD|nr:NADH-quinone oxidoreductase subunit NuoE [uncultured Finegoldia sp.]
MSFTFDLKEHASQVEEFREFVRSKKDIKGPLMPVLQHAQDEFGYLPKEIITTISKILEIPLSEIYGVITFYAQFSLIPKGKYDIQVCEGTACYVKGSQKVSEKLQELLNIPEGSTTEDQKFSISPCRCVGLCALAPVIVINGDVYGKVEVKELKSIIEKYN